VEEDVVDEVLGGAVDGGEHLGDFFGESGVVLLPAAFGGELGEVAFEDEAGFKHLPGLEAVEGSHDTEGGLVEFGGAVGDKGADAVTDLDDSHGREVVDAGAEAGAADFEGAGEVALGGNFFAGPEGSVLEQGADVVDHLHGEVRVGGWLLGRWHERMRLAAWGSWG
jgi:hypothetical protein